MATKPPAASNRRAGFPPGPACEALLQSVSTLENAKARYQPTEMTLALSQVARCYRGLGALRLAERYLDLALRWAAVMGSADAGVRLLCEAAEVCCDAAEMMVLTQPGRSRAAFARTREHALHAVQLAQRVADPQWEIKVLLRVSDVLNRCGSHGEAASLQARALGMMSGAGPTQAKPAPEATKAPARSVYH